MATPQILADLLEDVDYDQSGYTEQDRCAVYGYAKALFDLRHIDVDQLDDVRKKLGLSVAAVDELKV
ncbi:MAG: hypothetical protein IAE99_08370 [Rhodothermales bacterium]|nr:hypothetical protein [Rhodothermales bacterium]